MRTIQYRYIFTYRYYDEFNGPGLAVLTINIRKKRVTESVILAIENYIKRKTDHNVVAVTNALYLNKVLTTKRGERE